MGLNRRIILLAVVITAVIGSAFAASITATSAAPQATHAPGDGYFGQPWPVFNSSGNVTIDSAHAKATVEASIASLTVGTPILRGTSWLVPIQDGKGVVTSIQVSTIGASTSEQAKNIVAGSLQNGWKTGEPKLMRTMYNVPLLDLNEATIGYVMVDGRSGEIIRPPTTRTATSESTTLAGLAVTSEQAKTKVSDAVKAFQVGDIKDSGNLWMVSVKYQDNVVMTVLLGKLNTPTSGDAAKAVQDSMSMGWTAGEPRQRGFTYNVPIIDANGNMVGNIMVDGRTGEITAGFSPPHK